MLEASFQWVKISDPDQEPPCFAAVPDARALVADDRMLDHVADKLQSAGVAVRRLRYLVEDEEISGSHFDDVRVESHACHLNRPRVRLHNRSSREAARSARAAFEALWDTQAAADEPATTPLSEVVPEPWFGYFPYPSLNPAQRQAIPEILGNDENVIVLAPTGAGKTVVGMAAALRAILEQGRKAAWLVPQRSLTDELDRDLDLWRRRGLRIERLSGEHRLDLARLKAADLWVATTEKFESICRSTSLREVLDEVGALIVDEVHLLGDTVRGPVLEGLLARMRDPQIPTRLIGLSATVTNSAQIASWLHARLVTVTWRPGRLTWQLPMIAAHQDWNVTEASRARLAAALTSDVTADGGSVLVFCGNKRSVRLTALVIAASRGADVRDVHPDDVDQVYLTCRHVGVGLHYKDWEHRSEAEEAFRARQMDVLVATTTVAAGVNLPARAVIVRDTQVGFGELDTATVLQMFGRSGRAGTGEEDGWAFLIVDEHEHAIWRRRLIDGHTVDSQIQANLPEQLLSEAVQGRVTSESAADRWWLQTLAHHQGSRHPDPLRRALRFLLEAEMVQQAEDAAGRFTATELGRLTSRLMVAPATGTDLRKALADLPFPDSAAEAERLLIRTLATTVPRLAQATAADAIKPVVAQLLTLSPPAAGGERSTPPSALTPGGAPGDFAQASLLVCAAPEQDPADRQQPTEIEIPYSAMYPILEEAPRILHWLGNQGHLGTVHPWCAIVAADLSRRIRWRRLEPRRGAGRLLWMLEQMADQSRLEHDLPGLWQAALERGHTSPDWPAGRAPTGCVLDDQAYAALLRERTTDCRLSEYPPHAWVTGPAESAVTWSGPQWRLAPLRHGSAEAAYPNRSTSRRGVAVFTRRGDYRATDWLAAYNAVGHHDQPLKAGPLAGKSNRNRASQEEQ
ncbi:DEAD/DEAH box helicase [Actinocrinis sp.]|uniref:DEAD/DEAH box helicase n=1 Tax=Actinocrinis sp. TaxID=1920516 RepID=UPI0039C88EC8